MTTTRRTSRAGSTEKISVSIDRKDLVVLRRRARRLYGGNLSAVVAESAQRIREEEGREALVAWLGQAGEADVAQRDEIRAEWTNTHPSIEPRRRGKTR